MISPGDISAAALWVTGREGSEFVSDPYPSRYGVSLHYHPELTLADIQNMTQARAAGMFVTQYWLPEWNALPPYIATPLLAYSVLEGYGHASQALQKALGVTVDGKVGPQTIAAAGMAKQAEFLETFFGACVEEFMESPRWPTDGVGWCRRQLAATVAACS